MPERNSATEGRGRVARVFRIIGLVVSALLVAWLLIEIVPRVVDLPGLTRAELSPPFLVPNTERTKAHPYIAYVPREGWRARPEDYSKRENYRQASHNSLGLRGPETTREKPPGTYRIVCIGGSSVYGHTESSDETTWPARLQEHLNAAEPPRRVEVINGGGSGYSTFEMLINLELRLLEFDPDLVVVYEAINDVRCALYSKDDPHPRPDNTHWRAVWPVYRPSPMEEVLERSYAYLIWRRYGTDYTRKRAELGFYAIVDYDPGRLDLYVEDFPLPEQGFANFRRNLVSIVGVARAHGAQVLLSTQAMWFRHLEGSPSKDTQTAGLLRAREILRAVAAAEQVPLADTAAVLEAAAEEEFLRNATQSLFAAEVHLTDAGSDLLARTLATRIQPLIP
jgi:lysophospholipase L1-like esterase